MRSRCLNIDWKAVDGASKKKRILHLTPEEEKYVCPVVTCLHDGYLSVRGLRKHINSIHPWYFWFDEQPQIHRQEAVRLPKKRLKSSTHNMPSFSITSGIGYEFLQWLMTPCGGGKSENEATQQCRRAMKFIMHALGESSSDAVLNQEHVDCCLGTPSVIINFMQSLTEKWELSHSGSLNYLKSLNDLMDYRKSTGVTDNVLRTFAVSEVYIRRGIGNLARQKKVIYNRNLDLEQLIARNSWATIKDMENVIPYHAPKFQDLVKSIKQNSSATVNEIAFATRFIVTFLFLRVKCTRPMSYKFLTLGQLDHAKKNGGYIDQTTFKTASTYTFDTIILSTDVMAILDTYVQVVRPLAHPSCDYVIVNSNGKQYSALGTAMSILVFQAIGKGVNPTRYRQIVESESAEKLNLEERAVISKDQRHSSQVAEKIYQKKLSRDVAQGGLNCLRKLVGIGREEHNNEIARSLSDMADKSTGADPSPTIVDLSSPSPAETLATACDDNEIEEIDDNEIEEIDENEVEEMDDNHVVLVEDQENLGGEEQPKEETTDQDEGTHIGHSQENPVVTSVRNSVTTSQGIPATTSLTNTYPNPILTTSVQYGTSTNLSPDIDVEIKREEAKIQVSEGAKLLRFTPEEDLNLKEGTKRYGLSNWSKILKDTTFRFHASRTRDALRVRAETIGITKRKKKTRTRNSTK